jgi:hypothetical protein
VMPAAAPGHAEERGERWPLRQSAMAFCQPIARVEPANQPTARPRASLGARRRTINASRESEAFPSESRSVPADRAGSVG